MEQRISIVTLGVRDLAASQAFHESLGWKCFVRSTHEVVFFQLGGVVLSLLPRDVLAREAEVEPHGSGFSGVAFAYNTRGRAEVDAVMAQAERAGARVRKAIQSSVWGDYGGSFLDLDGYVWQVAWNPGFDLPADGSIALRE